MSSLTAMTLTGVDRAINRPSCACSWPAKWKQDLGKPVL
jgi:hypothetical protein